VNGDSLTKEFGNVMTSILQNATKDNIRLQLKRIAVGAVVLVPVAAVIGSVVYLVSNGYINVNILFIMLQVVWGVFMLWTVGGAYESYRTMRRNQKELEEHKTFNAFKKLGHGEQYNGS
jgi:cobalamin biosynthesis protein CobD/CbiB